MRPSPEGTGICHPDEPSSRPGDLSRAERAVVHPLVAAGLGGGGFSRLGNTETRNSPSEVLRILVRTQDLTLTLLTTSISVESRTQSLK